MCISNTSHVSWLFWSDLDFASLARGFALLRMPKMPELRGKTFPGFEEVTDTDSIRFKDKNREKQRQKMLQEQKEKEKEAPSRKNFAKNKAWSKQKSKKDRRRKISAKRKMEEVRFSHVYSASRAKICVYGFDFHALLFNMTGFSVCK